MAGTMGLEPATSDVKEEGVNAGIGYFASFSIRCANHKEPLHELLQYVL